MAVKRPPNRSVELLWDTEPRSRRGPKAALDTGRIAQAGIAIADSQGLGAVSMQRIAAEFGFTTMSLYRYVPGKRELVDLMFDTAIGLPPDLDAIAGGWRPKIDVWGRALLALLQKHPWGLEVLTRLRLPGPRELHWMEAGAHALEDTGLSGEIRLDILAVIMGQVRVTAQYTARMPPSLRGLTYEQWARGLGQLMEAHGGDYPALTAAMHSGALGPDTPADDLSFGLRCVLDGVAVRIAEYGRRRRP